MRILGISEFDNDASAALLVNGKIVAAAQEERFSRKKQHAGFPYKAIGWILEFAKLDVQDLDLIAIAKQPAKKEAEYYTGALNRFPWFSYKAPLHRKLLDVGIWYGRNIPRYTHYVHKQEKEFKEWLKKNNVPQSKVRYINHHLGHAATAYYFSGFDDALIITCDGQGHGETATVYEAKAGRLMHRHSVFLPNSMGFFYSAITKAAGFKPNRHEGKITGLAAYAPPHKEAMALCNSIAFFKNGSIHTPHIYGAYPEIKLLLRKLGREAMAASFQHQLEEVITSYVRYYLKKYPHRRVALAGGVFANVKLNQRIAEIPGVKEVFVFPGMADLGISVGAAILQEPRMQQLQDVYFGPSYSDAFIESELEKHGLEYTKPANIAKSISEKLANGYVVGLFNGRMEFGPRALGNRSILYETTDPKVNDWLNKALARSEFMPFAPVTLSEHAERCYKDTQKGEYAAKFMTMTFDCTPKMKKQSPAVVHVDGTARPQLIDRKTNPLYYDILKAYHKRSGIPSLVNTSFNMHEEPIVCSPYDAIRAFKLGRLDCLLIGSYLVENEKGITSRGRR